MERVGPRTGRQTLRPRRAPAIYATAAERATRHPQAVPPATPRATDAARTAARARAVLSLPQLWCGYVPQEEMLPSGPEGRRLHRRGRHGQCGGLCIPPLTRETPLAGIGRDEGGRVRRELDIVLRYGREAAARRGGAGEGRAGLPQDGGDAHWCGVVVMSRWRQGSDVCAFEWVGEAVAAEAARGRHTGRVTMAGTTPGRSSSISLRPRGERSASRWDRKTKCHLVSIIAFL